MWRIIHVHRIFHDKPTIFAYSHDYGNPHDCCFEAHATPRMNIQASKDSNDDVCHLPSEIVSTMYPSNSNKTKKNVKYI